MIWSGAGCIFLDGQSIFPAPVDGLTWVDGTQDWKVEGKLAEMVVKWKKDTVSNERKRNRGRWVNAGSKMPWTLTRMEVLMFLMRAKMMKRHQGAQGMYFSIRSFISPHLYLMQESLTPQGNPLIQEPNYQSCPVIWVSSWVPTSPFHLCPWSHHSSKAIAGLLSSLFLSS